jgi:acyl phosphate:glycerol-3-phosphate acyltransferase
VTPLIWAIALLGSYLLGSVPFAVVSSRLFGLPDPRSYGSGNPGATNVLRSGSKPAALMTLLGDAAKGAIAVLLARHFGSAFGIGEFGTAMCGLAAFLGHLFPVFLRFRGGKGVATYLGLLLALQPLVGLIACGTWLLVAALFRFSSLASMSAALVSPFASFVLAGAGAVTGVLVLASAALIERHRGNIGKLLNGTEQRIGQRSGSARS